MHTDDPTQILTTTEAAHLLNIDDKTLANWRSNEKGPSYLKLCGCVRYRLEDLQRFVEEGLIETTNARASTP